MGNRGGGTRLIQLFAMLKTLVNNDESNSNDKTKNKKIAITEQGDSEEHQKKSKKKKERSNIPEIYLIGHNCKDCRDIHYFVTTCDGFDVMRYDKQKNNRKKKNAHQHEQKQQNGLYGQWKLLMKKHSLGFLILLAVVFYALVLKLHNMDLTEKISETKLLQAPYSNDIVLNRHPGIDVEAYNMQYIKTISNNALKGYDYNNMIDAEDESTIIKNAHDNQLKSIKWLQSSYHHGAMAAKQIAFVDAFVSKYPFLIMDSHISSKEQSGRLTCAHHFDQKTIESDFHIPYCRLDYVVDGSKMSGSLDDYVVSLSLNGYSMTLVSPTMESSRVFVHQRRKSPGGIIKNVTKLCYDPIQVQFFDSYWHMSVFEGPAAALIQLMQDELLELNFTNNISNE